MMADLFGRSPLPAHAGEDKATNFYHTPSWACEAIVERWYGDLSSSDTVIEPACGKGHFLDAIPWDVPAIGIEMDPGRAAIAHQRTGREIIVADVRDVVLPVTPTLVIGNPPFAAKLIDSLLERVYAWLPNEGRCGFILPAFIMTQLPRVVRESERWAIAADLIPRDLFPGPRLPVVFARFEKKKHRTLVGFALFSEAHAIRGLPARVRHMLTHGRSPAWREVVLDALRDCGGEAALEDVYRVVAGRRPSSNQHWKPKVRQVLHHYADRVGPSTYRIPA